MKAFQIKIISFLVLISMIISCNSSRSKEKDVEALKINEDILEISTSQFENSNMKLGEISVQTFDEIIKTNGYIDVPPPNKAKVSAIMGGYIKKSPLLVGNSVVEGQLLLTIENPDFIEIQQHYLEVSEQLHYLKSENDRQKILFEENIASQKNYLKAKSDYKSALAMSNGLEQKLRLMNINPSKVLAGDISSTIAIYAPISGSISAVNTNVGEFKNPSEVLIEIINYNHKHLELIVFEKDVLKVKEEQAIRFRVPESSLKTYDAEVHLVGKSIDENRTVRVHGHLGDESISFLVGMFVEAEIITNSVQKSALPTSAFIEEGDNYYVLVLVDQNDTTYKFEKVTITVGGKIEDWIEVIDQNSKLENKQILLNGAFLGFEN